MGKERSKKRKMHAKELAAMEGEGESVLAMEQHKIRTHIGDGGEGRSTKRRRGR